MLSIGIWMIVYAVIVAASIVFIGRPIVGLQFKSLVSLLADWRFLFGCFLALCARFIFVIINNLTAKNSHLNHAHLTTAALATQLSIIAIIIVNAIFLHEHLRSTQMFGAIVIIVGVFIVFS